VRIGDFDTSRQVFVVAEIGNNHEGDFALAQEMVRRAAEAGVDAVKFQTFVPDRFVTSADTARLERLRHFQLSYVQFEQLAHLARGLGVMFFSTPLDIESARFLNTIQTVFKIASGDNTFFPLIETVAEFGKPMIISTGLATMPLLERLRRDVRAIWKRTGSDAELAFLHCVVSYPVPLEQAALGGIAALKARFTDCTIGYSDHTVGTDAALFAVAAGARIIEKHFTIDKNYSDFRDHQLSADPVEMRDLVQRIRALTTMMGSEEKVVVPCEEELRTPVRRSIAAARDLAAGAVVTRDDLIWLRPGTGIPAGEEDRVIGHRVVRAITRGELIAAADLA
jgi:N,N'-diacetyllegionaminate synthase